MDRRPYIRAYNGVRRRLDHQLAAKRLQKLLSNRVQTGSSPWTDMKPLEFSIIRPDLRSSIVVHWPVQSVASGCKRRLRRKRALLRIIEERRQHAVKLEDALRAGGARQEEETSVELAEQAHHSPDPQSARRAHLHDSSFKSDPGAHAAKEQNSGARRWIDMI